MWTESKVEYINTYDYPHCTVSPDFIIGNSVSITIYNPLGRNCHCIMYADDWSIVYSGDGWTGTSIAGFNFAEAVSTLYKSIPTKNSGKYHIKITWNGVEKDRVNAGTYSIRGNEYPSFSNFTYEDTNATTKALTGNNQILVNGYSNLKVTISTANKAYSNYGATLDRYRLNVGNMSSVEASYSSNAEVSLSINSVNSPSITVTAIDKRGYAKSEPKSASFKSYFKPIIKALVATRSDGGVGNQVTLQFSGEWWNDNFGKVDNTIKTIEYYYKKTTDNTWTKGNIAITADIKDNDFSGSAIIEGPSVNKGFDVSTAYNIKIVVTDALATSNEYQTILGTGAPALAIYDNKVSIGLKYDEDLGGALQVKGEVVEEGLKVSSQKPEFKEKVWIEKSKNLLYTPHTVNNKLTITANRADFYVHTGFYCYLYPDTRYTFSMQSDATFDGDIEVFLLYNNGYDYYLNFSNQVRNDIWVAREGYYYIRLDVNVSGDTRNFWNFQIEEGDTATEWEQYKETKIKIRNKSNVYENFLNIERLNAHQNYNVKEQLIGTWYDGKPLYRVVYKFDSINNNGETLFDTTSILGNAENIRLISGSMISTDGSHYPIPMCLDNLYLYVNVTLDKKVRIRTNDTWDNFGMILVFEYTKTTD